MSLIPSSCSGFSQGRCTQGPSRAHRAARAHPEPTEQAWSLLTWLVLHLQLTGPFNEKCQLGTGTDVRGISERAAQVE